MVDTPREHVFTALSEHPVDLPANGLTLETVKERAFGFEFEADETLSFRIERHPTMYLSEMGVPGLNASPARFHVVTEYQLDLADETWHIEEFSSTFEYNPWLVIEAELGAGGPQEMLRKGIEEVTAAADPEATFDDVFGSWINHWELKMGR